MLRNYLKDLKSKDLDVIEMVNCPPFPQVCYFVEVAIWKKIDLLLCSASSPIPMVRFVSQMGLQRFMSIK